MPEKKSAGNRDARNRGPNTYLARGVGERQGDGEPVPETDTIPMSRRLIDLGAVGRQAITPR